MKLYIYFFYFFLVALSYSCRNHVSEPKVKVKQAALPVIDQSAEPQVKDVIIYTEGYDTLSYSKAELALIEQLFPEFNETFVREPAEAYYFSGTWKEYLDSKGDTLSVSFGSEAGQDNFYLLYAYYLRKKNGLDKYEMERSRLTELYRTINGIHEGLSYGGTYYGHQHKRIAAFAEYSIYLLRINAEYYNKKYDFTNQKNLYLKQLKQYIDDEESVNIYNRIKDEAYIERKLTFDKKLNMLDSLITDYFYLNNVQTFEMNNYR